MLPAVSDSRRSDHSFGLEGEPESVAITIDESTDDRSELANDTNTYKQACSALIVCECVCNLLQNFSESFGQNGRRRRWRDNNNA
jgi:hypothetical protein